MGVPLDSVAHIIQVALTPVFLLTGIASMLNVITARLGRVADHADAVLAALRASRDADDAGLQAALIGLRRRVHALDVVQAFGAFAAAATCGATFALFLGALQDAAVPTALFLLFVAAVLGIMAALVAFFAEVLLSWDSHALPRRPPDRSAL